MARQLTTFVRLRQPDGMATVSFGPGDDLPDWAAEALEGKDHLFSTKETVDRKQVDQKLPRDEDPEAALDYAQTGEATGKEPGASEEGKGQLEDANEPEEDEGPPKGNASRPAWAEFAEANGVPVTKAMSRDDIKEACAEAGVLDD